ncbi:MAG: hypothetical protein PHW54_06540, partial [Candidatus Omnitrophica bacterium]|nr:hypothetical protein [Candidatus Omnitrophota bacterium]
FSLIGLYLVFSFDYYYAYFMVVAMILIFFYWQIHRFFKTSRPNRIAGLKDIFKDSLYTSLIMLFCFLIILPIIMRILNSHVTTSNAAWNMSRRAFEDLFSQSAKPLSYFLPSLQQPVLGGITGFFIGSELYGKSLTEHVLFLGWIPIILAIVAVRRWRVNKTYSRENFYIGLFTYLTFVFWIFSQPPWWQIGPLKIYMPSFFMYKFLPMFRAYCRFGILVMLGVSILAGFGIKFILSSFKNRFLAFIVYILFCVLILFEFWSYPPFKIIYVNRVPPVYSWLKAQPGLFVIAEYPLDIEAPNEVYKFYQTKHDKKMINGAFPGTPANKFLCNIADLSNPNTVGMLNNLGVKYVLVHSQDYQATGLVEDLKQLEEIKNNSSLRLVKDFNDGISVYEIVRNTK